MNFLKSVKVGQAYTKYTIPLSNLFLIRWHPKAVTENHGHDGKQCDFIVLKGVLHECRHLKGRVARYRWQALHPLKMNSINDNEGTHQIFNFDDKEKWSIHRYV
jgi:hypothetical protein